ncbi:MAG: ABC transporter ATP-binding protein [Clostridia bacterium]|nr:ABC transporter ATP-binding protein [Clostridia bacterium]
MDVIKKSWEYFRPYKKTVFLCYFMSILVVILNMVNPKVTGYIFDNIFSEGSSGVSLRYILLLFGIMIGVTVIKHVINYSKARILERRSMAVINALREDCMAKFFSMSFETFNKAKTGNVMTTLADDAENVKNIFSSIIPVIFESVFSFVTASVILFYMNWQLALACYVVLPFIYLAVRKYSLQSRPVYINMREQTARLATVAQENINGVRQVRAFAREEFETAKMDKVNEDFKQSRLDYVPVWSKNYWKMFMLTNLTYILTIGFGGILVCYNRLTLGEMVAFTGYITYLMNPLNLVPTYVTNFLTALISGQKILDLLNKRPSIESPETPESPKNWDLDFNSVSLSYDGNVALSDINLHIKHGMKVGIVGATGSGKSSFINLIPRFYDPVSGSITLGGADLKEIDLKTLRDGISIVMQDVFLFSNTIKSNIAYCTDGKASDEEIKNAAHLACADEFISEMPDGYDTIVGERGVGLSGGQKQRISMARAFMKPCEILILDDSTSALDNETEREILNNIDGMGGKKTVIVIASRISSVKSSDIILFMDHGKIAESGTHDELMALDGRYADVYRRQYSE